LVFQTIVESLVICIDLEQPLLFIFECVETLRHLSLLGCLARAQDLRQVARCILSLSQFARTLALRRLGCLTSLVATWDSVVDVAFSFHQGLEKEIVLLIDFLLSQFLVEGHFVGSGEFQFCGYTHKICYLTLTHAWRFS